MKNQKEGDMLLDVQLPTVQSCFNELFVPITSEYRLQKPVEPPLLSLDLLVRKDQQWFPVQGMYGGFSYVLQRNGQQLVLRCRSWSRVVGGSGQEYHVTAQGITLVWQESLDMEFRDPK